MQVADITDMFFDIMFAQDRHCADFDRYANESGPASFPLCKAIDVQDGNNKSVDDDGANWFNFAIASRLPAQGSSLAPGAPVEHLDIVDTIGEGEAAIMYLAYDGQRIENGHPIGAAQPQ